MKDVQERPSAPKREHPALQNVIFFTFSIFMRHFRPPESGSAFPMQIWIQPSKINGSGFTTMTLLLSF